MDALNKAIDICGGVTALAELLKIDQSTVSQWKKRGLPPDRAVEIERATKGKVKRHHLLPKLFGKVA